MSEAEPGDIGKINNYKDMKRKRLPKVSEKFYWEDLQGEIHEETCREIRDGLYFCETPDKDHNTFLNEEEILDPDCHKVRRFLHTGKTSKPCAKKTVDVERLICFLMSDEVIINNIPESLQLGLKEQSLKYEDGKIVEDI